MFALTKEHFCSWLHIKDPTASVTWKSLTDMAKDNDWKKVYISLYDNTRQLNIKEAPEWAIPVYTGSLLQIIDDKLLKGDPFDSWIDVISGPQRLEDITSTHQIRLLTSVTDDDIKKVKRFVLASTFSPHMWRLTIQERNTFIPLSVNIFNLPIQTFPILGLKEFNNSKNVGMEYNVNGNKLIPKQPKQY